MIPKVAALGTGFVGAGMYYMHDKRESSGNTRKRPSAAEYFLSDKGPEQSADRVGFTATRNLPTDDPMTALRHMAFTATHAHDIRVAAVAASAKAAGLAYDDYVKKTNPFRGRKGGKPVYSLSLSFEPGDPDATKENMLKAADQVRHVLGLQDHQCLIVEHTDTRHPHVHLIINRVNPNTGKFASLSNDRLKLSEWALEWERRHGRIVCPQRPENWKKRDRNTEQKRQARHNGNDNARAGYVKHTGLPPSEIEFWNKHGSHDLAAVRLARAVYHKQNYELHKRVSRMKLKDVTFANEVTSQRLLSRIDRSLSILRGERAFRQQIRRSSPAAIMFSAVRGAALSVVGRLRHRSDIAKLLRLRKLIMRDMDIRRSNILKERRAAFEKMKRIHAWQNWLDEKRCRSYRGSDTRDYRERMTRYDITRIKPPLFGSVEVTLYDVEESKNWRQAHEDRRALGQPIDMKPIKQRPEPSHESPRPYSPRNQDRHADAIARAVKEEKAARQSRSQGRIAGRKRKPRPRRP